MQAESRKHRYLRGVLCPCLRNMHVGFQGYELGVLYTCDLTELLEIRRIEDGRFSVEI